MPIHALNHPTTRKKTRVLGVPVRRANGGPQEVTL
jgi:hypothetical protein